MVEKEPASYSTNQVMSNQILNEDLIRLAMTLLTLDAAYARVKGKTLNYLGLKPKELLDFCQPIRRVFEDKFSGQTPQLSVVIRAFNEEREILPTLLSYAFSDIDPGRVEIVVANNNSSDRTAEIAEAIGAKTVSCARKGIGFTTKCGYDSRSASSQYVMITDADTRVLPPVRHVDEPLESAFLRLVINYCSENPKCAALSTGICEETPHWSKRLFRYLKRKNEGVGYWTGPNQTIRTSVLDAIGGINPNIEFGAGEDFYRVSNLVRYCRKNDLAMESGKTQRELDCPVYASSRRTSTLWRLAQNRLYLARRGKRRIDEDGLPIFSEGTPAVQKHEIR